MGGKEKQKKKGNFAFIVSSLPNQMKSNYIMKSN